MSQTFFEYVGDELHLFSQAKNWKGYWSRTITPYVGQNVLDVGAGIGATAHHLATPSVKRWLALEPDPSLAERMAAKVAGGQLPAACGYRPPAR